MRTAAAFRRFPHQRTGIYENFAPAMCVASSIRVVCVSVSRSRLDARMMAVLPPNENSVGITRVRPVRTSIALAGLAFAAYG